MLWRIFLCFTILLVVAVPVFCQTSEEEGTSELPFLPAGVGEVLLTFLVLSVVFEVALTPVFNWRFFIERFEGRGCKTPITVALAFLVFWGYKLDIIKDLLVALGHEAQLSPWGQILTALLIAGGSDGVLRIFRKLQIREDLASRQQRVEEAKAAFTERKAKKQKTRQTS